MRRVLRGALEVPVVLVLLLGLGLVAGAHWAMRRTSALALLLLLVSCTSTRTMQLDSEQHQHDQLAASEHLRIDEAQHVDLDQHQLVTAGPVEQVREVLAPDGGVVERVTTRWGGSTQENWLREASAAEEHVDLDAGMVATHEASAAVHEREKSHSAASAGCMLGLGFWGAVAVAVLLGAGIAYLKLRP